MRGKGGACLIVHLVVLLVMVPKEETTLEIILTRKKSLASLGTHGVTVKRSFLNVSVTQKILKEMDRKMARKEQKSL